MKENNLLNIDELIALFMEEHKQGIITLHKTYFSNNELSIEKLISELIVELRTGCVDFLNKEYPQSELGSYLFYIANEFCKKKSIPIIKKKSEYICPGCMFLNKHTGLLASNNGIFICKKCELGLEKSIDRKDILLYKTFFIHNKQGYRCDNCSRFIPHPLDNNTVISCPYYDCMFVGSWDKLKRMHHPVAADKNDGVETIKLVEKLEPITPEKIDKTLQDQICHLKNIINSQIDSVAYSSSEFTIKNKLCCYRAFLNLLDKFPMGMVNYLLHNSRSGGFQQKIFQEYINILEKSLPYSFKKNNKIYKIESLLDEQLSLFDGISVFEGVVSPKLEVKNNTSEFYIGGRKASYAKPYYIGKILSISDKKTKESLMNNIEEYGFFKIKLKNVSPGIEVIVSHLRIPPHYQMGGMVYVNRLRKNIIEQARSEF